MTWQIIEGKNRIPICLFEAVKNVDAGKIYLKDEIILNGSELIDCWQKKLGNKTIDLCKKFLLKYPKDIISVNQEKRSSTKYRRRTPKDSEIDINKTLKEQFNLLRTVDNINYPAFFKYLGQTYILKIEKKRKDV